MVNKHKKMYSTLFVIKRMQAKTATHPPEWLKLKLKRYQMLTKYGTTGMLTHGS